MSWSHPEIWWLFLKWPQNRFKFKWCQIIKCQCDYRCCSGSNLARVDWPFSNWQWQWRESWKLSNWTFPLSMEPPNFQPVRLPCSNLKTVLRVFFMSFFFAVGTQGSLKQSREMSAVPPRLHRLLQKLCKWSKWDCWKSGRRSYKLNIRNRSHNEVRGCLDTGVRSVSPKTNTYKITLSLFSDHWLIIAWLTDRQLALFDLKNTMCFENGRYIRVKVQVNKVWRSLSYNPPKKDWHLINHAFCLWLVVLPWARWFIAKPMRSTNWGQRGQILFFPTDHYTHALLSGHTDSFKTNMNMLFFSFAKSSLTECDVIKCPVSATSLIGIVT